MGVEGGGALGEEDTGVAAGILEDADQHGGEALGCGRAGGASGGRGAHGGELAGRGGGGEEVAREVGKASSRRWGVAGGHGSVIGGE